MVRLVVFFFILCIQNMRQRLFLSLFLIQYQSFVFLTLLLLEFIKLKSITSQTVLPFHLQQIIKLNQRILVFLVLIVMEYKQYEKSMLVYRGRKKNNKSSRYDTSNDAKTQNLKSIHRTLIQKSRYQNLDRPQRESVLKMLQNQQKDIFRHRRDNLASMHQLNIYSKNQQRSSKLVYHSSKKILNTEDPQVQRNSRPRHNLSVDSLVQTANLKRTSENKKYADRAGGEEVVEKPVNFYINIQKLKNLKISSRDKIQTKNKSFEDNFLQSESYLPKNSANNLSIDKKSLILKGSQKSKNKLHNISYDQIQATPNGRFITRKKNPTLKPKMRYKTHQNQVDEEESVLNPPRSHASQYLISKKSNFRKHEFKDKSFIEGYLKGKQLGRGGFSKVWQGFHFDSKKFYAVKQIDTTNKYQTHLTEIWFGNYFFQHGRIKSQFEKHSGCHKLLKMYEYSVVDPKAFIVYENCDGSLGNMLYDIYEEDVLDNDDPDDDQKIYMIKYKHLYGELRKNIFFLKHFIKSIAEALDLLTMNKIVHSDIKTENILLKKRDTEKNYQFKLIDYGSSFVFESLKQYKLATPEYMCPELLNYILFENKKSCHQYMLQYVKVYENTSAIDVWGLGCIVIELIHGLPLWLNNPTKIYIKGHYETKKGLFAVSDRSFSKILQRQLNIVNNLDQFLLNENNSQIMIDQQIKDVLRAMLNPNPKFRIRPRQIVERLLK